MNPYTREDWIKRGYIETSKDFWEKPKVKNEGKVEKAVKVAESATSVKMGGSRNAQPERNLQKNVCLWLKQAYPHVYFMSDASGMRVSMGLRSLLKQTRSNHAALDLVILEPKGKYHGLIIELKKESPFKKNGELKNDQHLRDQETTMKLLFCRDYKIDWAWDFEQAKKIISEYVEIL